MDPDTLFANKYFICNRYLLRLASLWPYQKSVEKYLLRSFIIFSLFTMSVPMTIRVVEDLYNEDIDIDVITENIAGTVWFMVMAAKFMTPILLEKKMIYLYQEIMDNWESIKDDDEKNILIKYAGHGRLLTIYYAGFLLVNIVPYMTIPAVMPIFLTHISYKNQTYKKELIHAHAEFFVDQDEYFFYLYMHSIICGFGTIFVTCAVDSTYVVCVQQIIGLFHIVEHRLMKLGEIASAPPKKALVNKRNTPDLHLRAVECIKIHQKALEFADLIQETYDAVFFLAAIGLVAFFTFITVDLQRNFNNPVRCHRLGTLWSGCILHLFYVAWPGQKLIDISENIFRTTFECKWYHLPPKTKALIYLMMMRSSKPSTLTAGPFLEMKFEGVSTMLQAAFSYFSVLAAVSE